MRNDEKATGLLTLRMTCCWAAWVWYRPRLNESAAIDIVWFQVKMFNKRNLHLEERNSRDDSLYCIDNQPCFIN